MPAHKTSAWPLAQAYAVLIAYASLYPFEGWRLQGLAPWAFLASPWPRWWTGFDLAANVAGYAPLGFLLALGVRRTYPQAPAIVLDDADLDLTANALFNSRVLNTGQVCLGTERVYVQRPIFDRFVAALKAKAEGLKIGPSNEPGVGLGPLISAEHKRKVLGYYEKARAEGATVVTGGGVPALSGPAAEGHFVQPTIWTGLPETSGLIRSARAGLAPLMEMEEALF